jgi:hypothetical protein
LGLISTHIRTIAVIPKIDAPINNTSFTVFVSGIVVQPSLLVRVLI